MIPPFGFHLPLLWGTLLCFFGGAISAGGGVGGGAFYLSAFILILGFDVHEAVPLSKVTIFGLAVGGFLVLLPQRHPSSRSRTLIDYHVAMLLQPTVLLGTVGGVILNVLCPTWAIVVVLVCVFAFTSVKTVRKGLAHRREEQRVAATSVSDVEFDRISETTAEESPRPRTARSNLWPWVAKGGVMVVVLAGMLFFLVAKARVECGSLRYWALIAAVVPWLAIVAVLVASWLRRRAAAHANERLRGDLEYTPKQIVSVTSGGLVAGVFSAFVGIGGGIIVGPVLLSLDLISQVATATSSFSIIFMSSSSSIQYLILGKLNVYYAMWYFGVGFASAIVGQLLIVYLIKKTKRQSYVDFVLAGVIVISCLAMMALLVRQLLSDFTGGDGAGFHHLCGDGRTQSSS